MPENCILEVKYTGGGREGGELFLTIYFCHKLVFLGDAYSNFRDVYNASVVKCFKTMTDF